MEQASEKQIGYAQKLGIENPSQYDKQALRGLIDVALKKQNPDKENVPVVRPGMPVKTNVPPYNKNTTMYVSYAKDIFCNLMTELVKTKPIDIIPEDVMTTAIKLVKQAQKEFS